MVLKNSMLIAMNDSLSARAAVDFIADLAIRPEEMDITLLHVFRKPSAGEDLMGKKFMKEQPAKYLKVMESAKEKLVEKGCKPDTVKIELVEDPYPTVGEGIIDQFNKGDYSMVVIGRKRMSKAEEFVRGDVSIKLVRALKGAAVLVVTAN
ncbi:MAG: universal stress protein [Desulfobacterales bacterium]|jgi:nucleotide-binding universal stress UspA family protein